jgi:alpha-1,3-rhamnosyl/mannosyltransferase
VSERKSAQIYHFVRQSPALRASFRAFKRVQYSRGIRRFDLFHALNAMPPVFTDKPILPLVHDISHALLPETHPKERVDWLRRNMRDLDRYPLINTVSHASAAEIAEHYAYPIERLRVTHPGVNPAFRAAARPEAIARVAGLDLVPGRFFLMVSTIEPRKNHATLIEAYAALPSDFRRAYPLVLVGQQGWGRLTSPALEMLRREGSVRFLGYCDVDILRALYASATAFVFPTLHEGFGMPVVEAMAVGSPLILSDIPVMHEVGGDVATYLPNRDAESWARALQETAGLGEESRAEIATRARLWSQRYNWADNARATSAVYREILGRR